MALKFFNTLSRSIEEFVPLEPKKVGMYCCGPTIYDFAHIGNWRTFVFDDLVRRYLEFKGFAVSHVMNITDVEDKIIKRVREAKTSLPEFTAKYEAAFLDDLKTLGCRMPHHLPRATAHIPEMISLIEKLMARGIAYKASDGSIYFSIEKYRAAGHRYGQLLNLNLDELRVGERVKSDEYTKESVADFALWKARAPEDGDVFWPSPWGEGRPGWHIECSAMSMKLLGASFDIHLGGEDLIFPHHEDEIAQSEGACEHSGGKYFVKYWLHGAHLLVEGKKMSKSLGNFFTLRDLLGKGFRGSEIRYLLLTAHYRETFNFTMEGLQGAKTALGRIDAFLSALLHLKGTTQSEPDLELLASFTEALDDDLNVSRAWGVLFEWIRKTNREIAERGLSEQAAAKNYATWTEVDKVFGVGTVEWVYPNAPKTSPTLGEIASRRIEIDSLLEQREAARKAKDFKRADAIRDELKSKGWVIEDTPKGPRLKRI